LAICCTNVFRGNAKLINIEKYLDIQKVEDRRAFIIHGPAMSGKTQFVQRLGDRRNDVYILDLLQDFARNNRPLCDPDGLLEMLLSINFS